MPERWKRFASLTPVLLLLSCAFAHTSAESQDKGRNEEAEKAKYAQEVLDWIINNDYLQYVLDSVANEKSEAEDELYQRHTRSAEDGNLVRSLRENNMWRLDKRASPNMWRLDKKSNAGMWRLDKRSNSGMWRLDKKSSPNMWRLDKKDAMWRLDKRSDGDQVRNLRSNMWRLDKRSGGGSNMWRLDKKAANNMWRLD